MVITILLFLFILSIVVLTHEFGHFFVAKRAGMRVDEFGFGFPPRVFGFKRGETVYSINLFPIGGFVKIHGENGNDKNESGSFSSKPIWIRSAVIVAGVVMNFLVAYLFFSAVHAIGAPTLLLDTEDQNISGATLKEINIMVLGVSDGSPAAEAGLKQGDKIKELSAGDEILNPETSLQMREFINSHLGQDIIFSISRGGNILEKNVSVSTEATRVSVLSVLSKKSFFSSETYPAYDAGLKKNDKILTVASGDDISEVRNSAFVYEFIQSHKTDGITFILRRDGEIVEIYVPPVSGSEDILGITFTEEDPTGMVFARMGILKYSLPAALLEGGKTTYILSSTSVTIFASTIKSAIVEREVPDGVSGPLGIAVMTGTVRDLGVIYVLHFIALISLSLGIINIIPFPALDGGRFAFLIIEKIKGSPLPAKVEGYANTVGFALLILLIILVTYSDITKLF